MSDLTLKRIVLKMLDRLINPHFQTKFMWSLFSFGVVLVLKNSLIQSLVLFQLITESFKLSMTLSDGAEAVMFWFGPALIAVSIFLFYRRYSTKSESRSYRNLKSVSGEIRKYLEENRRIFKECGPNSDKSQMGEIHQDMGVWETSKKEIIVPNNQAIYDLLKSVKSITSAQWPVVDKMFSHIVHFSAHVDNPTIDYSNHQFPQEFSDLIYDFGKPSKEREKLINQISDWLKSECSDLNVVSVELFGSALYSDSISDFDLLVQTNDSCIEEIKSNTKAWKSLESNFYKAFSLKLHLLVFSKLEEKSHAEFVSKLTVKRNML